jgi:TonB-linked SusC/RagA family outer membrane protein
LLINKNAPQHQYNVNVSGGSNTNRYFVSLGYFNQDGLLKFGKINGIDANPSYTRYNIRANVDTDWSKQFSTSIKIGTSLTNSNYGGGSSTSGFFQQIAGNNPCYSPVYIDGKFINGSPDAPAKTVTNVPMYELFNSAVGYNFSSTLNIDVAATYKLDMITKGLLVRGKVSYDNYYYQVVNKSKGIPLYDLIRTSSDSQSPDYNKPAFVINKYEGPVSFNGESYSKNHKIYAEAAFEYNRSFKGGHTVTGLILGNIQRYYSGGNELPYNYMGIVSRVTYNYKNRYLAEFNLGINGSENFAKGNQYGTFPAYSAGWLFTEEPFFPKTKILTYGKIRASYGKVGNDKSNYRFLFLPSAFTTVYNGYNDVRYFFGEQSNQTVALGYKEKSLGNEMVTWETATKTNIGLDLKFFDDRLQFSGDYFTESRNDILWNLNVPITFGQPSLIAPYNIGKAKNHGYELELKYDDKIESINLGYWLSANYSFARNKIVYMDESPQPEPGLAQTGCRIGQPKGLVFDGFYNSWDEINDPNRPHSEWEGSSIAPGDAKYVDVNKDGKINANDRVSIGYPNIPEKTFAFSFGANYKGFDFSVMFQGAANVSVYTDGYGTIPFAAAWGNATVESLNRWEENRYAAGEKITQPRLSLNTGSSYNNYQYSTLWQQDGSYLRLKNMEIGYRMSPKVLDKIGVKNIRLYVNGQNLYTWTKMKIYDPERASGSGAFYPVMRVVNMGFTAQF